MIKKIVSLLFLAAFAGVAGAQEASLTLEACRRAAVERSPLVIRKSLAAEKRDARNRAATSGLLPQLEINAQGSYQNEVPKFPGDGSSMMPIAIDLPRDQYRATMDLSQVIYGGSSVRNTLRVNAAQAEVETASLDVQIDQLRNRINNTYMGILLNMRQMAVNRLMQQTLGADMKAVAAQVKYGTATGGAQAALAARMLELKQQEVELSGVQAKLTEALSVLTGLRVTPNTVLEMPSLPAEAALGGGEPFRQRPEMKVYAGQRGLLDMQDKLLNSRSNPKLSLFASGGYGRPGYNFLDRDFALMAIGGLRFNMPLTGWDATQKEKRANRVVRQDIDQQQRDFEREVTIEAAQYATEVVKMREVTAMDPQIVAARAAVRERALAQLKGGVITDADYLTEFNNELTARVNAEANSLRLVQAWVDYRAAQGIY